MSNLSKKSKQITLLAPNFFPGVSTVFRNMVENAPDLCHFYQIDSEELPTIDRSFFDADIVILGGWLPSLYPVLCKRRKNVSVLLCSSLGQMDLSGIEFKYLQQIVELKKGGDISSIITGSADVFLAFRQNITSFWYMPYPVGLAEFSNYIYKTNFALDIGFFMPYHGRKNPSNQLYAVSFAVDIIENDRDLKEKVGIRSITLKTNQDKISLPNLTVDSLGWLPRKDYLKTIKNIKLGLHVTFTESFGYGALDYLLLGVPVLVSNTVSTNLQFDSYLLEKLAIPSSDSMRMIGYAIKDILLMEEEEYKLLANSCWTHAKKFSGKQNVEFVNWLQKFIEANTSTTKD